MTLAARGGQLLASAGRRAVARGDAPAAVNLLERAGALLPEDAPERLELRLELADALHGAGDLQRVGELLEGALAQAELAGNAGVQARARLELACLQPLCRSGVRRARRDPRSRRARVPRSSSASATTPGSHGRCGESPTSTGCAAVSRRESRCSSARSSTHAAPATTGSCPRSVRRSSGVRPSVPCGSTPPLRVARRSSTDSGARSVHRGRCSECPRLPERHGRTFCGRAGAQLA